MNYIVYITVNLCNGKLYIGIHRTNPNVFDGYIGNGIYRQSSAVENTPFHKAVRKYGYENFRRTTVCIFPDTEEGKREALALEGLLVNETFLKSKNVYNVAIGGEGYNNVSIIKTVYMFDLNGNYLRSFKSSREAALYIDGSNCNTCMRAIRNNCLGTMASSYGYFWSYKKEFNYKNYKIRQIAQYTISGKFLRTFNSIAEAESEFKLNDIKQAIIKKGSAGGYQWRYYENNNDIPKLINVKNKNLILPIKMYKSSGEFIKEFNSVKECIQEYPKLKASQINRVLNKIIKSHLGYSFKYKDEDIV